jgi:hypothetical protein
MQGAHVDLGCAAILHPAFVFKGSVPPANR